MTESAINIETIEDISTLNFKQHTDLLQSLCEQSRNHPEKALSLLSHFYRLLEGEGTASDMLPTTSRTFAAISKHLSHSQITQALQTIHNLGKDVLIHSGAPIICTQNPESAEPIFNYIANQVKKTPYSDDEKNFFTPAVHHLATALLCISDEKLPAMFNKINLFEPKVQDLFISTYGKLFTYKPCLRKAIWHKLSQEARETTNFIRLYNNLEAVALADEQKIPDCLRIIDSKISDTKQSILDLKQAYKVLGRIRKIYPYTQKVDAVFMLGLKNPQNDLSSKKAAYRQMGKIDELTSRAFIGKRVEKTNEDPFGFKNIDKIAPDETAVLFLGGNGTNSARRANGYLSSLEKLLKRRKVEENIPLYAAIYDFGEMEDSNIAFNDHIAREKLMQDHHRGVKILKRPNSDTLRPRYIDELFEKTLLQRICDKNGNRLSLKEACAQIRKLTIITHCHGAYTFLKLEEKMQKKMQELEYSAEERAKIQSELLCVAHAPHAPLGVSKSTLISFASARDYDIDHNNNFETEIRIMSQTKELMLSYFPAKRGELFLTPSMGDIDEHNFIGYDTTQKGLNNDGKTILDLSGNAIVNGIKNSLSGEPLPPVEELVCGKDEKYQKLFNQLKENGVKMWKKISSNTTSRLNLCYGKAYQ